MHLPSITIVEYKSSWRAEFAVIAADLRAALGSAALRIDHIGSTAVPTLAAKDIIDVQVTVLRLESSVSEALLAAGFTSHKGVARQDHLPPGFKPEAHDWAKLFFMQRAGARRSNIHVRRAGSPNQRYPLLVRDFLRSEAQIAHAYGELKKRLSTALTDPDAYPEVKDPVADIIYLAAERWALANNWNLALPSAA
jgi:GrpB-like predicted nucleotidyltransferase (UPF0157 family)